MRFAFTDEQLEFRDAVRDLLAKECPPEAIRTAWENDSGRSPRAWEQLGAMGVLGLTAPESAEGLGMNELDLILLLEEAGYAGLPEPLVEHAAVAIPLLAESADTELAGEWLPRLATGEATAVVAGAGGEPLVPYADSADVLILRTESGFALVTPAQCDLEAQPSVDGARRLFTVSPTSAESAQILRDGTDGGEAVAALAFDRAALGTSAVLIGLAQRMLDLTVAYAQEREQFGVPIGSFQAIKHKLADVRIALEFARPAVYRAAHTVVTGSDHRARDVSMGKVFANRAAQVAADASLQCHGAIGYTVEYDLHLFMKRAWALQRFYGDTAHHRARVARAVL